jgi:hypothetical protein
MATVHPAVAAIQKSPASKVKVAVNDIDGVVRAIYLCRETPRSIIKRCVPTIRASACTRPSASVGPVIYRHSW